MGMYIIIQPGRDEHGKMTLTGKLDYNNLNLSHNQESLFEKI